MKNKLVFLLFAVFALLIIPPPAEALALSLINVTSAWRFENSSGADSHSIYNISLNGATINSTEFFLGSNSLYCDGVADWAGSATQPYTPFAGYDKDASFAVAYWVKEFDTSDSGYHITWTTGDNNLVGVDIQSTGDDTLMYWAGAKVQENASYSDTTNWQFIVLNHNPDSAELWQNARLLGGADDVRAWATDNIELCSTNDGGAEFAGIFIDEITLFNGTLNITMIEELYNDGVGLAYPFGLGESPPPALVTWDDGGGDSLASTPDNWNHDSGLVGNVNITFDGTAVGDVTWDLGNISLKFVHIAPDYTGTITLTQQMIVNGTFNQSGGTLNTDGFNLTVSGETNLYAGTMNATRNLEKFVFNNSLFLHPSATLFTPSYRTDLNGSLFNWAGGNLTSNGFINGSINLSGKSNILNNTLNVTDVITIHQDLNVVSFDIITRNLTVTNASTLNANNSEITVSSFWNSSNGSLNEGRVHNFSGKIDLQSETIKNMKANADTISVFGVSSPIFINSTHTGTKTFLDTASNMSWRYWVRFNVSNRTGAKVGSLIVNVTQNNTLNDGDINFSATTNSNGQTNFTAINVTSYLVLGDGSTLFFPNATLTTRNWLDNYAGERVNVNFSTINASYDYNVTIYRDLVSPSITYTSPVESNSTTISSPSITLDILFIDQNFYEYECDMRRTNQTGDIIWNSTEVVDTIGNFTLTEEVDLSGEEVDTVLILTCSVSDG